jgi:ethanolamine utilization protein EutA
VLITAHERRPTPETGFDSMEEAMTAAATFASPERVRLLGLDFGSTTSSALLAEARVGNHSVSGRMGFSEPRVLFRSEPVFTPFDGDGLDEQALRHLLDDWLQACGLDDAPPFAGAALITGLAARQDNAAALARLIGERIGDSLIAAADDPRLESWLAFMGNCATLSRAHPETPILNLDIGGGTTNPALGLAGSVLACGCHYIGARHWRFQPGGYRLSGLSPQGQALLRHLRIGKTLGDSLAGEDIQRLLAFQVAALEAIALGETGFFADAIGQLHQQVAFSLPAGLPTPAITFSGGVGELIYRHLEGQPWPSTTAFGDLGIDLARAILDSPVLSPNRYALLPETRGRATVYGLTLHSSEVSGASLYLPDPGLLPLRDVPILARLPLDASDDELRRALELARSRPQGACLQLLGRADLARIRSLGQRLSQALCASAFPAAQPLVLLLEANAGKTLGQYASDWGHLPCRLLVIDEIPARHAQFIHIGQAHQQVVPVAFFGLE